MASLQSSSKGTLRMSHACEIMHRTILRCSAGISYPRQTQDITSRGRRVAVMIRYPLRYELRYCHID